MWGKPFLTDEARRGELMRVPRPGHPRDLVACGLALLKDVDVHSCFVDGLVSNLDEQSVNQWTDRVAELEPRCVEIYTTLGNVSECGARSVSNEQLEAIAGALRERARVEVHVLRGRYRRIPWKGAAAGSSG